jgi:hypothetical protein
VSAFNSAGEGSLSPAVTVLAAKAPDAPSAMSVSLISKEQIKLEWVIGAWNGAILDRYIIDVENKQGEFVDAGCVISPSGPE